MGGKLPGRGNVRGEYVQGEKCPTPGNATERYEKTELRDALPDPRVGSGRVGSGPVRPEAKI